jgi:hypothetical protein
VDLLLLPTAAPWLKVSEAVDYLRAVAPALAVPIHQAILAKPEKYYGLFRELAPTGTDIQIALHGEPLKRVDPRRKLGSQSTPICTEALTRPHRGPGWAGVTNAQVRGSTDG